MTTLETLIAARKMISTPDAWCKGAAARNRYNEPVSLLDNEAAKWCAVGAVGACTHLCDTKLALYAHQSLEVLMGPDLTVARYNDASTTTHADILALFERAIVAAKEAT